MAADTTRTGPLGHPGAMLAALEIVFSAKAEPEEWRQLFDRTGISSAQNKAAFSAVFTALPEPVKRGELYLTCDVHPIEDDDCTLHWHLQWQATPSDRPPSHLRDISKKVGGYPTVLDRLFAEWPSDVTLQAQIIATYELTKKHYKRLPGHISAFPKPVHCTLGSAQHKLQPDMRMTAWRMEPPVGALTVLFTVRTRQTHRIIVEGRFAIALEGDLLNQADKIVWNDVALLLGGHND
jgi:hypothetical protein